MVFTHTKGASEASYKKWTEALRKVGASAEWKEAMMANGLAPFNKVGPDFQSYVDGVIGEVRAMSTELGDEVMSDRLTGLITIIVALAFLRVPHSLKRPSLLIRWGQKFFLC